MTSKYQAPPGYVYDAGSGKYYQSTAGSDPKTGKQGQWVTWFDDATGEYAQVFYPNENYHYDNEKNAGQIAKTKKNGAVNKKKLIAIITVVALLITGGVGTGIYAVMNRPSDGWGNTQEEDTNFEFSRADWISRLYMVATGNVPDPEDLVDFGSLFPDVLPDSFGYHEIHFAAELGWIPEESIGYDFDPYGGASRSFVAASVVRAAGYIIALGDDDADIPEDIFEAEDIWGAIMAFNLGLLNEGASEYADFEFIEKCVAFAKAELTGAEDFEERLETNLRENVSDKREKYAGSITFNDVSVTSISLPVSDVDFEVGEIVIFPATESFPTGVARKITSITMSNDFAHITAEEASILEIFDNLDIAVSIDLANEEFIFYWEDENGYNEPYLSYVPKFGKPHGMGLSAPLSTGWVQPEVVPITSPGLWNPNRQVTMPPIRLNEMIPIKDKQLKGEITGSVGLKRAQVEYTIRYCDILYHQIPLAVKFKVDYTLFVEIKKSGELYEHKKTLWGTTSPKNDFFMFQIGIPLNLSLKGEAIYRVEQTGKITAGLGPEFFQLPRIEPGNVTRTLEASFTASAETGFIIDINMYGINLFKTGNLIVIEGKVKGCIYTDSKPPEYCLDFRAESYSKIFVEFHKDFVGLLDKKVAPRLAPHLKKLKLQILDWIDDLDDKQLTRIIRQYSNRNFSWAMKLERTMDAMRKGLKDFTREQFEGEKGYEKAFVTSITRFIGREFEHKFPTTTLKALHYEGTVRESMYRVHQCTRNHRIVCEQPKTIAVDETLALDVYYERLDLYTKISLPAVFYEVEILSGQSNIIVYNGMVTGLREGTAKIMLTRIFVDLEGERMLSPVRTEFIINVVPNPNLCPSCTQSPCICFGDSTGLGCDVCFAETCICETGRPPCGVCEFFPCGCGGGGSYPCPYCGMEMCPAGLPGWVGPCWDDIYCACGTHFSACSCGGR